MKSPTVTVIGLGCIGGSFAKALTATGAFVRGYTLSAEDSAAARALDIVVPDVTLEESVANAGLIIIAVPVQAMAEVAAAVVRAAPADAVIAHCGGVQTRESLGFDDATFARVLGAHPLAGSHDSGFAASRADLFSRCTVSIEARRTPEQQEVLVWLWARVNAALLEYRTAEKHDAMMAWISHLPQLASTALAATFAAEHIDPMSVGPGARDSTRLAASSFEQWSALVQAQPELLDDALAKLESTVSTLREALTHGDQRALRKIWDAARDWRRDAEPLP